MGRTAIRIRAGFCVFCASCAIHWSPANDLPTFERHLLTNGGASITLHLAYRPGMVTRHPAILMLGALETNRLPDWSTNLVAEGYMLAAFTAAYPPDPDPKRRPVWLHFDERFAHSYALGAQRAIDDSRRVVDYLVARGDVHPEKIGWLGSSSTAIPGLAVVTQGLRLAAFVGFVCTGAYEQWFETWHENGLWRGGTNGLWPETKALLAHDPIHHASNAFPTAVLMVSGGDDKVVNPKTARAFADAARPVYKSDPERLRLVIYDGFGHNLPRDVIQQYAQHWFRLYMNPTSGPPAAAIATAGLAQSVVRSQVNAANHQKLVGAETSHTGQLEWIAVSKDGSSFVGIGSGRKFIPWGFNYDHDHKMRLLEEYWNTEWQTVIEDFREMKELGANVVRIHLQFAKFMDSPQQPNVNALKQLGRLVKLAEENGLYLDLTGLACYRKADVPRWYETMSELDRWQAQAQFWESIVERCKDSPAIFCYDLMNEPFVPGKPREPGDWLTGKLSDFYFVQALTLDPAGREPPEIAKRWASQLTTAIRRHDRRHLISLGMLPNSGPAFVHAVAQHLDFICVHEYPKSGKIGESLERLKSFSVGKPLVIEEMFPLTCTAEELGGFIRQSAPLACGWIGFYWGQTPRELEAAGGIREALIRAWLTLFQEADPNKTR